MDDLTNFFYSLYGLGCKPKAAPPELVGFLYNQFCQSIVRYHLDLRMFDIKKYARFRPMLEALHLETLKSSKICWELLLFLHSDYSTFEQKNTSNCKQLKNLEKKIHFDPMEYNKNRCLVDSVKFVCSQIKINMELKLDYFYFYKILNDLLRMNVRLYLFGRAIRSL
ncbi:hypothetical protein BpHYR1_022315 [Brachionus plicatilis]|uniref:Uncharacterized protein n=1 Tax=Brachionus plicatilis TaxID=10195 RepID=A0A3M7S4X9_BRAPC|nr:hypothetical protein BpHYR1_022315 [Brachionus plicatilis]